MDRGELMSELWAVVGALHVVDGEDVFPHRRSSMAMAMAPPTMAVPSGRLKVAFDMKELPKNVRSTSLNETADAAGDGSREKKDRAHAKRFRSRGRAPRSLMESRPRVAA